MTRHTFKKAERLTGKKTFDQLFKSGKSIVVSPFRWVWILSPIPSLSDREGSRGVSPVQLGIAVPKKYFAKAVDRNTLKRRIREAYRKNKHPLYEILKNMNHTMALMIIYTAKEQLPYTEIEQKMVVSLHKLIESIK